MDFYGRVDELLWSWAAQTPPIINFTMSNVMRVADLGTENYDRLLRYLMSKEGFWLHSGQLLLCPENHPGDVIPLGEPVHEDEPFRCWCGQEFHYNPDYAVLVFNFTPSFRDEAGVKKNSIYRTA